MADISLKLDNEWYCDCARYGEVQALSAESYGQEPQIRAMLMARNLNAATQGIFPSPYCTVPSLSVMQEEAWNRRFDFTCQRFWRASRCDDEVNKYGYQLKDEATAKHKTACIDAAKSESQSVLAAGIKARTAIANQAVDNTLAPEAREEARVETEKKNSQMGWIALVVVLAIGGLAWYLLKK